MGRRACSGGLHSGASSGEASLHPHHGALTKNANRQPWNTNQGNTGTHRNSSFRLVLHHALELAPVKYTQGSGYMRRSIPSHRLGHNTYSAPDTNI